MSPVGAEFGAGPNFTIEYVYVSPVECFCGLECHSSRGFLIFRCGGLPQLVMPGLGRNDLFGELGSFRLLLRDSYQCFGLLCDGVCGRLRFYFPVAQFEDAGVKFGAAPA